jgi:hypothetical protein
VQLHDRTQYVAIGISSNDVPSTVGLQSAGLRVLECMPQINKGNAPILHRLPRMITTKIRPLRARARILRFAAVAFNSYKDKWPQVILSSLDVMPRTTLARLPLRK